MQTPFTPHFDEADIPFKKTVWEPFRPRFALSFIDADCTEYWVNDLGQLIYRWHDGFDVFIAALEAQLSRRRAPAVSIPVESLLHDLHLVYQLYGETQFPGLALSDQHYTHIYAAPDRSTLRLLGDYVHGHYGILVAVPKGKWVTRVPRDHATPFQELLRRVRHRHREHHFLEAMPITSEVRVWLHLLLTLPRYPGMRMDSALNHPVAHLIEAHLAAYRHQLHAEIERTEIKNARELVGELFARMEHGISPTTADIAEALHTTPEHLRATHYQLYGQQFRHFIVEARIKEALRRLMRRDTIKSIAFALGWTDETHFVKQFKRYTGITPGQFMKNIL